MGAQSGKPAVRNTTEKRQLAGFSSTSETDFGEDIHAADLGGYPEFGATVFDTHDGCLAADPTLLARRELGRED